MSLPGRTGSPVGAAGLVGTAHLIRAALLALACSAPTALAAPEIASPVPGQVVGTVRLAAPPATLRAGVADPRWVAAVDGDHITVTPVGPDGDCLLADYVTPSVVTTIRYRVRQCPTAAGVVAKLVASSDLSAYEAEWTVVPDGAGSRVTYRLALVPRFPLPESVMTAITRRGVASMLDRFVARFGELPPG